MGISAKQNNPRHTEKTSDVSGNSSSANKTRYQKVGKNSLKKIKFHSKSCEDASKQERIFHKLDPKNPREAHKVNQRQKAITKGKNTIGYDIYCRTIPKDKRQKRSMITPSTPDHTLDIPNKKWNGLVRSWYVAIHYCVIANLLYFSFQISSVKLIVLFSFFPRNIFLSTTFHAISGVSRCIATTQ